MGFPFTSYAQASSTVQKAQAYYDYVMLRCVTQQFPQYGSPRGQSQFKLDEEGISFIAVCMRKNGINVTDQDILSGRVIPMQASLFSRNAVSSLQAPRPNNNAIPAAPSGVLNQPSNSALNNNPQNGVLNQRKGSVLNRNASPSVQDSGEQPSRRNRIYLPSR